MIKKLRSKLAVKVFLLTAALMMVCCSITYLSIVRFAPYIYTHDVTEAEDLAYELALILDNGTEMDIPYYIEDMSSILADLTAGEFVYHIFRGPGEEVKLTDLHSVTGRTVEDYMDSVRTNSYRFAVIESGEEYFLFASQNTEKESMVVEALKKSLPTLSIIVIILSIFVAFFYTFYMTRPIKRLSSISRQMAELDFSCSSKIKRTDEIGILSDSLNGLSAKLSRALGELQEANCKLKEDIDRERQLERQRSEFFAAASHELKTPITIIKGQLEGMLYQIGRYKDRETYLAEALGTANDLEKMVREILTISRLDAPGYMYNKCSFDLSDFIEKRLTVYEDLFLQQELTLEKSILPQTCISGDIQLLEKVFNNLISNAAAYSPAGNRVLVKLWREAEGVKFTIENTGVHIPEKDIPKLFEAFYRVDSSRNRQTGGSGLGLHIVKTILDLHGAVISIENTSQGVLVSVQL